MAQAVPLMRYALYFTPAPDDPLTLAAQAWLGRDAFTGKAVEACPPAGFTPEEFCRLTQEPRRYGFHATLVAPFRLREEATTGGLTEAADSFAAQVSRFTVPSLSITRIGRFFALTPARPERISALASEAVDWFDGLRAPLNDAEIERRRPALLSERQRLYLHRYGYPYVKEEFRFHMTLTGPVEAQAEARVCSALHRHFDPLLARPLDVSAVALFIEAGPLADFVVHSIHRLGMAAARRQA